LVSIVLVDDHQLIQQGLKRTLESCPDFQVVGTGNDAEDGLFRVQEHQPDLAIIDLGLPDHSGLWLLRRIHKLYPDMPVLILTMHDDPEVALVSLNSGARGYVRKSAPEKLFLEAVRVVSRGEIYLEPAIRSKLEGRPASTEGVSERVPPSQSHNVPTAQELLLLQHLSAGMTNNQMADELGVSVSTVKARLRALFGKLQVDNRTEAVAEALKRHLIVG
jgi:two-component system, NarL family, response regulator YdfI